MGGISSDSDGTAVDFNTAKGPVFCTAIIAGTMAVKRTSELIPFCHPLPIEKVAINVALEWQSIGDGQSIGRVSLTVREVNNILQESSSRTSGF